MQKKSKLTGQEIHDLCQFVLATYASAVSTCTDFEIKKRCRWDMDQLEALLEIRMLVKRDGAGDGIISCAIEVGQIFDDLISALDGLAVSIKTIGCDTPTTYQVV